MSNPARFITIGLAFVLALLAGCATTKHEDAPESEESTLERIRGELDQGAASNQSEALPPEVQNALMPEVEAQLPAEVDEARFDISVNEVPAREFFMGLVQDTPYNMMVHPDVSGQISLELKDVSVPIVMDMVRRVYGYEFEKREHSYIVMPARLQQRIFYVDYLNVSRGGESNTRVNSGQVTQTANNNDSNNGGGGASRTAEPGARIATESDADFWDGLEQSIRGLIGDGEGRNVVVQPQAGIVVVRAMPPELRDVGEYLEAAQTNLQRQVILEAKILEVRLSEQHEAGVNWGALGNGNEAAGVGQTAIRDGSSTVLTDSGTFDPTSVTSASGVDFGGLFAIGARTDDFAALIRLLDSQGDVQVLSSPRVSTVNNQKAVIKVGTDEFFVTDIESDTDVSAATSTRSVDVDLTPFFSGIALDVTPQIGRDGDVTLHVHPTVSEVRDQVKNITVAGQTQSLPLAFSQVRESDSVVRARDGQVIVIGGLMQDESMRQRAQAGGLGDLPLIGGLFRQRADSSRQTELVILLKPIIADSGDDWSGQMEGMSRRLRGSGNGGQ